MDHEQFSIDIPQCRPIAQGRGPREKRWEILGEDHPDTLWTMGNLAWTYYKLGRFLQAEELCAGALDKHRKVLGEDHPDTIRVMCNLALTYRVLNKVPEAEELERLVAYHEI
jgi:hypothetical protein